ARARKSGQPVVEPDPGQLVLDPDVTGRRRRRGVVERGEGEIDLLRAPGMAVAEGGAAGGAEAAVHVRRRAVLGEAAPDNPEGRARDRQPGDVRRAACPSAAGAVAIADGRGRPARPVAQATAQAVPGIDGDRHGFLPWLAPALLARRGTRN